MEADSMNPTPDPVPKTTREIIVERGALKRAGSVFQGQFGDIPVMIVADETTYAIAGDELVHSFAQTDTIVHHALTFSDRSSLTADYGHVGTIVAALRGAPAGTIPVALGSGTINDLVKRAAHEASRPYMVVATAASMDGYTASGAALIRDGFKQTLECPAPVAVIADLEVLAAAPASMTAAGYGDLIGKVTAGADWITADALGIEPILPEIWSMVQEPLRAMIATPQRLAQGDPDAIARLMEGLVTTGLAIQASGSSRPASGSEHQFSHLWEMDGIHADGVVASHGFKVGIGSLASTALYEELLRTGVDQADASTWPTVAEAEADVRARHAPGFRTAQALSEVRAKYVDKGQVQRRIDHVKEIWPDLSGRLREQVIPLTTLRALLKRAGCPTEPEQIGLSRAEYARSFFAARQIRRRYTVLDLVHELGLFETLVDRIVNRGDTHDQLPATPLSQ